MKYKSLTTNADFKRAYYQGKSFVTPYFVLYVRKNRTNDVRVGITVSKKLGHAVKRNRAKRVLRVAARECFSHFETGNNYVFVARNRILKAKSTEVANELKRIFVK